MATAGHLLPESASNERGHLVVAAADGVVVARTPDEWAALVRSDLARSVEGFVAAGRHLAQARKEIPHGQWEAWTREQVGITPRTAHMLMDVARNPVISDRKHVSDLPASWGTLYQLSRLDAPLLESAIQDGRVHPDLERKQAKALVAEYRIRSPERARPEPVEPGIERDAPPDLVGTIVADPPWRYGNTSTRGAAEDHYPTMSIEELCDLDVANQRAADQSHLYLWTTAGHLPDAFKVMTAWGFEYKTYLVWVKPQMGMGNYFRVSTELVLFGVRGGLRTNDRGLMNYFQAKRAKHSAKPRMFRELVKRASPGPYLEMFCRCQRDMLLTGCECSRCEDGWDVWGNQS